jgi:hypothetical protein
MSSVNNNNKGNNKEKSGSSSALFPKIIQSLAPGSPKGTNPKQENTIPASFQKQKQSTKGVKLEKERRHIEQRAQIIELLTPPASHLDQLRTTPLSELCELSDVALVTTALQLVTNDDPHGYNRTNNVSIPQLLALFALSAKSREQSALLKLIKNHAAALKDIARVDKYIKLGDGNDDIDDKQDDDGDDENISVSSSMEQLFKSLTPVEGLVPAIDVSARPSLKKPFSALAS